MLKAAEALRNYSAMVAVVSGVVVSELQSMDNKETDGRGPGQHDAASSDDG